MAQSLHIPREAVPARRSFFRLLAMASPHLDGVAGVIGSFFTVVEVAEIITILLANSNPRHISLLNAWCELLKCCR